jgi:hypothetical protein
MTMLSFMNRCDPEEVRCRVYDGIAPATKRVTPDEAKRREFVTELAGPGVIDCPAYDPWVAKLQARGWLPGAPKLEPNPDGPGKVGRWLLTDLGREEWDRMRGA